MLSLYFTEAHEWLLIEDLKVTVGITEYAKEVLGDIVFIELPDSGNHCIEDEEIAIIESVKTASEIRAPVSGTIVETNTAIVASPELVKDSSIQDTWFFRIIAEQEVDISKFFTEDQYKEMITN